jgi:hypothetical protein
VTIAAGFLHNQGVLLCSDTELTGWAFTLQGSKITRFEWATAQVAMAYAGYSEAATAAIQKCEAQAKAGNDQNLMAAIERTLDRHYRKAVLSHPDYKDIDYKILIAIQRDAKSELYVTNRTSVKQVSTYDCIGIGDALAHSILRPHFMGGTEDQVMLWAAYMLASIKGNVPGCGGASVFFSLRNDGTWRQSYNVEETYDDPGIHAMEKNRGWFEMVSLNLFFRHVDPLASDADFEGNLGNFCGEMRKMRERWKEFKKQSDKYAPHPAGQSGLESPTPAETDQPPSRE